jgi:threonine dehydrogenase-like Zn-dependent dehydrogenase
MSSKVTPVSFEILTKCWKSAFGNLKASPNTLALQSICSTVNTPSEMHQTALVIGSGLGGLAAAQVLSKYFDQVVVVEKDTPPPEGWSSLDAAQAEDDRQSQNRIHHRLQHHHLCTGS